MVRRKRRGDGQLGIFYVRAECPNEKPMLRHNYDFKVVRKYAAGYQRKGCKIEMGWKDTELGAPDWPRTAKAVIARDPYRRCYRSKSVALAMFVNVPANRQMVERHGGLHVTDDKGGFDATNERFGLRGNRRVRTLADALWYAMPRGHSYCLDKMDLRTLNENRAVEAAGGFHLPDHIIEIMSRREQERYWKQERFAGAQWRRRR